MCGAPVRTKRGPFPCPGPLQPRSWSCDSLKTPRTLTMPPCYHSCTTRHEQTDVSRTAQQAARLCNSRLLWQRLLWPRDSRRGGCTGSGRCVARLGLHGGGTVMLRLRRRRRLQWPRRLWLRACSVRGRRYFVGLGRNFVVVRRVVHVRIVVAGDEAHARINWRLRWRVLWRGVHALWLLL